MFLAPVAAGFVAHSQGWRWAYWWCSISIAINIFLFVFFYEKTKFTVPALAGANQPQTSYDTQDFSDDAKPRSAGADDPSITALEIDITIPKRSYRQRMALVTPTNAPASLFFRHIWQPFVVLAMFPAILYVAFTWGSQLAWFSMINTTSAAYFLAEPYNLSSIGVGLLNLPAFVGATIASIYTGFVSDKSILWLAKRNRAVYEPEFRLYAAIFPALALAVGVTLYGLSLAHGMPWIVPAVGIAISGFDFVGLTHGILTYLLDGYGEVASDALVGGALVCNMSVAAIVFAATPWSNQLGMYDLFICIRCLEFLFAGITVPIIYFGKSLLARGASRYKEMALSQYNARAL